MVYVPSHVLSGLYYDKKRSLATGLATSGSGVGAIIFPLLVNFLVDNYGWRGSFYIVCGISMQNFVFASLLRPVPESLKKRYAQAAEELQVESSESDAYKDSISERNESERLTKDTSNPGVLKDTEQLPVAPSDIVLLSYSRKMSLESEAKETEVTNVRNMKTDKKADEDQEKPTDEPSTHDVEGQPYCSDQNECAEPNSPTHLLKRIPSHESDGNHSTPRNSLNEVEKLALTQKSTCAVLCDYAFIIYFINNILWNMGVVIILLFGPQYFLSVALDEQTSATVFSIGGFGAFAGSILGGFLGNIKQLRLDVVYIVMTVLTGIVCLLFPMSIFHNFLGLTCLYVVFSVVANIIMGLLVVAVAAIVGPEALGTGMGFVMLANGIGSVAAPPLIGEIYLNMTLLCMYFQCLL